MRIKRILLLALFLLTVGTGWADGLQPGSLTLEKGSEAQLTISLQNPERNYGVFQFDLILPEGLSVAKNDTGTLKVSLNKERASDHSIGSNRLEDGTYRILAYSLSNTPISGTEGPLVYITVKAEADVDYGDYQAQLKKIVFSVDTYHQYDFEDVTFKISIPDPSKPEEPSTPDEPKVITFDEDVDDSSSKEVILTFVVNEDDGSGTPTVAISDDKDVSSSVSIPETVTHNGVEYKVTEIGAGAFQNNTGLTDVIIPASITSIGANAFAGCINLRSITIYVIVPINLPVVGARGFTRAEGSSVFEGVNKETCILYVPEVSVDAYKAAPVWKEFKNILPIKSSTGIQTIMMDNGEVFDVYSLSGHKVKSKTTSLDGLPRGIYIINGKKVMK